MRPIDGPVDTDSNQRVSLAKAASRRLEKGPGRLAEVRLRLTLVRLEGLLLICH